MDALKEIIRREVTKQVEVAMAALHQPPAKPPARPDRGVRPVGPTTLTPAALSEKTGFRPSTLANWRVLNQGPAFFKIGRLVRYDEAVVEAWLAKQRESA